MSNLLNRLLSLEAHASLIQKEAAMLRKELGHEGAPAPRKGKVTPEEEARLRGGVRKTIYKNKKA